MIIAWYPGAGGNRFYQWIRGQTTFKENYRYDELNQQELKQKHLNYQYTDNNRYPTKEKQVTQSPVIFTHCVNYKLITQCWPDHDTIYFIDANRSKSLRRQWALFQKEISLDQHPASGPFNTIAWHEKYYAEYPWDVGSGHVVDYNTFPDFLTMLDKELDSVVCNEFDFAQQMFDQYGPSAPIIDLYRRYYDKK